MSIVLIPIIFLILVSTCKKIPLIGGNLYIAFIGAGILSLVMGNPFTMGALTDATLKSFNAVAFIAYIILFGSTFSVLQIQSGAMEAIMNILRALFGKTPQGLVLAILIALYFGGSLMGTVAAVGAAVGLLIVPVLADMKLHPDLICATIVTGASMGGMMPPVSNAIILACSLMGIDSMAALSISYVTVGIGLVVIAFFFCKVYVGDKYSIPEHLIPKESAGSIFAKNWKKLIPVFILILIVMLNSIPGVKFDLGRWLFSQIPWGNTNAYKALAKVYIIGKILNNIVMAMIIANIACFVCDPSLFGKVKEKLMQQMQRIVGPEFFLIVCAFFMAAFKVAGQNKAIAAWAASLSDSLLIFGGSAAMVIAGMLSGGQSTAQAMLLPILNPAWSAIGIQPLNIALASSHLAMAGQGLPPCDMNTFIIAGLVSGLLGKEINPMRSMLYSAPYCFYLMLVGIAFFYISL